MKPNKLHQSIIRKIIKKTINNIQEDPEREIRNLIDLGSMFAGGKFQKQFFSAAENELKKENSQYYKIAIRLIQKTDAESLLTFGMNLGYNSLTYGAKKIHSFEEKYSFNVPWILLLELSEEGRLNFEAIDDLVGQGKKMGILSYVFILQAEYSKLDALATVMAKHHDCAFILLTGPDTFADNNSLAYLSGLRNILFGVDIGLFDKEKIAAATKVLRDKKLLCAAFYRTDDDGQTSIKKAAELAADFEYELLLILRDYSSYLENQAASSQTINDMRKNLTIPVIPFEILTDIVMVDRNISTEGCLAIVLEDGEVYITNAETKEQEFGYNIIHTPLTDILTGALSPKDVI